MRTNRDRLPRMSLPCKPSPPGGSSWQVTTDGEPFCLFRVGGITLNVKVGDSCFGWMGDHIEPGVSALAGDGGRKNPNLALQTFSCIGNTVRVTKGDAKGAQGVVTGKHGGVEHLMIDFADDVLEKLTYDDKLMVEGVGQGLKLLDYPEVAVWNTSPRLLDALGLQEAAGKLEVPVAAVVPGGLMGSGIGSTTPFRGDYDIQTADRDLLEEHGLTELKLGDLVAIRDHHHPHGWATRKGAVTLGVVIHADSFKSGHGPGVTTLMSCGPDGPLRPVLHPDANLAPLLGIGRARSG
jgi:hypothetical protein